MTAEDLKLELSPDRALSKEIWAEMRRTKRVLTGKTGRLGYGGPSPGLVGCRILDLSESGVRVETYVSLTPTPAFFSIEFGDVYCRVRTCWVKDHEIGLEFMFDAETTSYLTVRDASEAVVELVAHLGEDRD
jgi:hypothetical protein